MNIIVKRRQDEVDRYPNLTEEDMAKVIKRGAEAVAMSFKRDRKQSRIVLLSASTPSDRDIKYRIELAEELFRIAWHEKQWNFQRCLAYLPDLLYRKLDNPNWDFHASEEKMLFAAKE